MKKTIIAVLIGAIILFAYQAISWMVSPIHKNSMKYTPNEQTVLESMSGMQDGMYMLPGKPPGTSESEMRDKADEMMGKPWAMVMYHSSMEMNMGKNSIVGLLLDIIAVWVFVWLLGKMGGMSMGGTVMTGLAIGLLVACTTSLMNANWMSYPMHYVTGEVIDAFLGWLFAGLWLGWYLNRKPKAAN